MQFSMKTAKTWLWLEILNFFHVRASHDTFFGRAHVGYLPKGKVIGLSKIHE